MDSMRKDPAVHAHCMAQIVAFAAVRLWFLFVQK
jgi:hypothetical protein